MPLFQPFASFRTSASYIADITSEVLGGSSIGPVYGYEQVSVLTPTLAKQVLNNLDPKLFFPDGFLTINWQPFRPMSENYELILDFLQPTVFTSRQNNGECEAISFLTLLKVKNGLRYDFDYYGSHKRNMPVPKEIEAADSCNDIASNRSKIVIAHLLKALIFINQTSKGCDEDIIINVFLPDQSYVSVKDVKRSLIVDLCFHVRNPVDDLYCSLFSRDFPGQVVSRM